MTDNHTGQAAPTEGAASPRSQARYFDAIKDTTVALHVDTGRPDHVLFQTLSALDAVATVLDRADVEALHDQLGAWLAAGQ